MIWSSKIWNVRLARVISFPADLKTFAEFASFLAEQSQCQSAQLIAFPKGVRPSILFDTANTVGADQHMSDYLDGAYLLDPFYRQGQCLEDSELYFLDQVAPLEFQNSEYYLQLYRKMDLVDECCFVHRSINGIILISLARFSGSSQFSPKDRQSLIDFSPVVHALLEAFWNARPELSGATPFGVQMDAALGCFGSSVLTDREQEVIQRMLGGHTLKSAAIDLSISEETIKHHRKNVYRKLDISSHPELFELFLRAVKAYNPAMHEDPLFPVL